MANFFISAPKLTKYFYISKIFIVKNVFECIFLIV